MPAQTRKIPGLWTMSKGEFEKSIQALEASLAQQDGDPVAVFNRLRAEPDYAKRVAEFMLREGLDASLYHQLVRRVMGKNFFGLEDWSRFYGVSFSQEQLRFAVEFPWGEDILNSTCPLCGNMVKDCHFAFLGLDRMYGKPLTIMQFRKLYPATLTPYLYGPKQEWYSGEMFARKTIADFRWYLLHQNIVPKSEDKTYGDQKAMLKADYEVPSAVTEGMKDLLVLRKTGLYMNVSRYANCRCVAASLNRRVTINLSLRGLDISCRCDHYGDPSIGIAASRRLPAVSQP